MSKSQMMSTTNYHFHSLNRMKAITSYKYEDRKILNLTCVIKEDEMEWRQARG